MIEVKKLHSRRWKEYRDLRLEALKSDPIAFSSSFEEEKIFSDEEWKRRINNVLFAISNDKPVGMIGYIINNKNKTKHIANIFGVYVKKEYRRQGIGKKLFDIALKFIQKNVNVFKINLGVNSELKAAIELYKKHGFKIVGRLKKELLVDGKFYDELMMERIL